MGNFYAAWQQQHKHHAANLSCTPASSGQNHIYFHNTQQLTLLTLITILVEVVAASQQCLLHLQLYPHATVLI
jgi:hypothetical protein